MVIFNLAHFFKKMQTVSKKTIFTFSFDSCIHAQSVTNYALAAIRIYMEFKVSQDSTAPYLVISLPDPKDLCWSLPSRFLHTWLFFYSVHSIRVLFTNGFSCHTNFSHLAAPRPRNTTAGWARKCSSFVFHIMVWKWRSAGCHNLLPNRDTPMINVRIFWKIPLVSPIWIV